jgi:virginiamycin B lyase
MTTTGAVTEFALPANNQLDSITTGPDGNLWFTDTGTKSVGRITPAGVVTEFVVTDATGTLGGIAAGADGNIWFTETTHWQICAISP